MTGYFDTAGTDSAADNTLCTACGTNCDACSDADNCDDCTATTPSEQGYSN